jgi:hypothetical protein
MGNNRNLVSGLVVTCTLRRHETWSDTEETRGPEERGHGEGGGVYVVCTQQ